MTDVTKTTKRLQLTTAGGGGAATNLTIASFPNDGDAARVTVLVVFRDDADTTEVAITHAVAVVASDGSVLDVVGAFGGTATDATWADTPTFTTSGTSLRVSLTYSNALTLRWDVLVTIEALS